MIVFYPIALIYFVIIKFRNWLFDSGIYKEFKFGVKTINVGNLTVGGTGKTPHVEYLINLLSTHYQIATLSRGYGRKSKGFLLANDKSTAKEIGDEPLQFYKKFYKSIVVSVGEQRLFAIPNILQNHPLIDLIILDDAYQHRYVKPHLNILLTDYNQLFYKDKLLPVGRLREDRDGAKRANIIVVSKCPSRLDEQEMADIASNIKKYNAIAPVFFSGIRYLSPKPLFNNNQTLGSKVILVTGIAKAQTLIEFVIKSYTIIKHFDLNDHHNYSIDDVSEITAEYNKYVNDSVFILTTEKDMVKLVNQEFEPLLGRLPIFYIPIETYFLKEQDAFNELINNSLQN